MRERVDDALWQESLESTYVILPLLRRRRCKKRPLLKSSASYKAAAASLERMRQNTQKKNIFMLNRSLALME